MKRPSQERLESILTSNFIANCTVTADDARRANIIYGPDVYSLKANMVKPKPTLIESFIPMTLPSYILSEHKDVTLCADFFYVKSQVFIYSLSRKIKFNCVANVQYRSHRTMVVF